MSGFIGQMIRRIIGTAFNQAKTAADVTATQILSDKENKLGEEVYALYLDAVPHFKKWWDYMDRCERYYRGEARPDTRGKNRTNANHNIIFSDIETIKPTIRGNLTNPVLFAENKKGFDVAKKLNLRAQNIWKDSKVRGEQQELTLFDILVGGTTYFRTVYDNDLQDVRVLHTDNRRILFDISCKNKLNKARWIMDVTATTPAAIDAEFRKKVVEAGIIKLESDEHRAEEPTPVGSASQGGSSAIATQGDDIVLYGSRGLTSEKAFSDKVERALRIELWMWDLTKNDDGSLKYPEGRRVTVGVGLSKKGKTTDKTRPEVVVLEDIKNPCVQIAKRLKEFPFVQIQCHDIGQIMGMSEASGRADIQDLVNDALNQLHDNWKLNNSPVRVVNKRYGLTDENVVNAPDGIIVLDCPEGDVRKAIYFDRPPPMAAEAIGVLSFYIQLNEQGGGAGDIIAGRQGSGAQSGVAISQLQGKAQGRFQTIAKSINDGYRKAFHHAALNAQDFDKQYDGGMELINEQADFDKPEERYVDYDPSETRDVRFRTEVGRKLSVEETNLLLQAASAMEANTGIPGIGELVLEHSEERLLLLQWRKIRKEAAEAAQAEERNKIAADAAKQKQDAAKRIATKALEIVHSRRTDGQNEKSSND